MRKSTVRSAGTFAIHDGNLRNHYNLVTHFAKSVSAFADISVVKTCTSRSTRADRNTIVRYARFPIYMLYRMLARKINSAFIDGLE